MIVEVVVQPDTQSYEVAQRRLTGMALAAPVLETMQNIPGIHEVMPEPFDITNHAGNFWVGGVIATAPIIASVFKEQDRGTLDAEEMSRLRRFGVAGICGATALVNCITETKWGVTHLPIARWLGGTTPDTLDTIYSTVWAGIGSFAFWKKTEQ